MRLIYFAPVPWDSYEQRPHYFVRHFLDRGGQALWVDPYPARLPRWSDAARLHTSIPRLPLARPAGLDVLSVRALPIDPLPAGSWVNARLFWRSVFESVVDFSRGGRTILGIGRPTALALAALDACRVEWSFYDAMDDFPEFYSGRSKRATAATEAAIAGRVSHIYASSSRLARKFSGSHRPVRLVRNAYDMSLLDGMSAPAAGPRLGFIGCLGGWFDWPLVAEIAAHVAPAPVTLVGPVASPLPARLPPNIELQPPCHQSGTIRGLQQVTVGLIPFAKTMLTAGIDPIKYYQYRGAGLSILSTRFGDMAERGVADATFFADAGTLESSIEDALAHTSSPAAIQQFREDNSWTRRLEQSRVFDA